MHYTLFIWPHWVLVVASGTFFFSCGMQALSCGTWDLVPPPGIDPGAPAWELGVLGTGPPGKSLHHYSFL